MLAMLAMTGLMAVALPMCSPLAVTDFCAQRCECQGCSDIEQEECEIRREGSYDEASAYDCDGEYLSYLECLAEDGSCQDGFYGNCRFNEVTGDTVCSCLSETDDYQRCIDRARDAGLIDLD
jgi:hypothetical protein